MATFLDSAVLLAARDVPIKRTSDNTGITGQTKEAFVSSITLAMIAITVVSFCLARRLAGIASFAGLPLARWCEWKPSRCARLLRPRLTVASSNLCDLHRQLAFRLFEHRAAVEFRPEQRNKSL